MLQLPVLESFILETKDLNQQYAHAFSAPPIQEKNHVKKKTKQDNHHLLGHTL